MHHSKLTRLFSALVSLSLCQLAGSSLLVLADETNTNADAAPLVVVSEQALGIHQRGFVFDGHNDLPWQVRKLGSRSFETFDISQPQPTIHTDIPRLRRGGVGAQYWSVYVPVSTINDGNAHLMTLEQIEMVHAMVAKYPETFELALTHADILRIRAAGKIASLIGVEGGHCIENSLENLRRLHSRGARYMTLTHSSTLDWADSSTDASLSRGLNDFGKEVVREMNRLGMLVDISHVAPQTMQAVLDTTRAPVVFSHSSCRAVADHVRNVPDEILRQLPKNGGVVMVNFFSGFIVPESAQNALRLTELTRKLEAELGNDREAIERERKIFRTTNPIYPGSIHDVVKHIDHAIKVAGIDHVGLGGDFDGVVQLPKQLEDVSCYPKITQLLLERGYTESDIHKVLSGNIMRIIKLAEDCAVQQ